MKQFTIEVPEGNTACIRCPFYESDINENTTKQDICQYLSENKFCDNYNFTRLHIFDNLTE